MKMILTALAALPLCSCAGMTPQQGLKLGVDLYCGTLSEAGRQVVRDRVTGGTAVLTCKPEMARP